MLLLTGRIAIEVRYTFSRSDANLLAVIVNQPRSTPPAMIDVTIDRTDCYANLLAKRFCQPPGFPHLLATQSALVARVFVELASQECVEPRSEHGLMC